MPIAGVRATIARYVSDDPQPGLVECHLVDTHGRRWSFLEKSAVVSQDLLNAKSPYPRPCVIACEVVGRAKDSAGREVLRISTATPWGMQSVEGETEFEVYATSWAEEL